MTLVSVTANPKTQQYKGGKKMYFRNKFNEEFLFLANNISPKGGSVRLDNNNPLYFIFEKAIFDEKGRYITVKPILLYNKIETNNSNDRNIEDWIVLCENRSDTIITCLWDNNYLTKQDTNYICDLNFVNINGDLVNDEIIEEYSAELDLDSEQLKEIPWLVDYS